MQLVCLVDTDGRLVEVVQSGKGHVLRLVDDDLYSSELEQPFRVPSAAVFLLESKAEGVSFRAVG